MTSIHIKPVETPQEMEAAKALRRRVFVEEQGVREEEEYDAYDEVAFHAVALHQGTVIGTGRLFQDASGQSLIGRMAIEASWRRRGVGGQVLAFLEGEAVQRGFGRIVLHAQTYVQDFYAKHGYQVEGDVFLEAGIEHVLMTKML